MGACFFTFFEKFVWLLVHVKITRNIRQPPTTLEKNPPISFWVCLPIPCVSLGFCFKIPQIFVVRFLFLKITQNLSFFFKLQESIFEKALFKINQKSFKTLMGLCFQIKGMVCSQIPKFRVCSKSPQVS